VDVGVDGEGGRLEGLGDDHLRRLVSYAWQGLQRRELPRHLPAILIDEDTGQVVDVAGLARAEAAGLDDLVDVVHVELEHGRGGRGAGEQEGRDLVDAGVGALGAEQDGDEEAVGVGVGQRDGDLGVEGLEQVLDLAGFVGAAHGGGS